MKKSFLISTIILALPIASFAYPTGTATIVNNTSYQLTCQAVATNDQNIDPSVGTPLPAIAPGSRDAFAASLAFPHMYSTSTISCAYIANKKPYTFLVQFHDDYILNNPFHTYYMTQFTPITNNSKYIKFNESDPGNASGSFVELVDA